MSTQVNIPTPFGVSLGVSSLNLLSVNASRKYLQVQNKSKAGAIVTIKFDNDFVAARSGVQTLTFGAVPDAGNFTLTYGGQTTPTQAFNVSSATVQAAMEALSSIGAGNILVTGTVAAGFVFTFAGALALVPTTAITVSSNTLTNSSLQASATQVLSFSAVPTAGTFQLVDALGNVTAALAYNITAMDLAAAINALPAISGGVSNLTQDPGSKAFSIYFAGVPTANTDVALLVVTGNSLTSTSAQASAVQVAFVEPAPLQGTFKLMMPNGETTAAIAYNANAAAIQAALELLPVVGVGNVLVTGSSLVGGFTMTFRAALANTFIAPIYIVESTLHPDVLTGIQKRVALEEARRVVTTVPGHGTDSVTVTPAFAQRGRAPVAVTTTMTINFVGNAVPVEGIQIAAGDSYLREIAVPVGAMWAISDTAATPVEVWEG